MATLFFLCFSYYLCETSEKSTIYLFETSLNCIFFRAFTSEIYHNCFLLKFFANVRQICHRKRIYVSGRVFFKSQSGRRSRLIILSLYQNFLKISKYVSTWESNYLILCKIILISTAQQSLEILKEGHIFCELIS